MGLHGIETLKKEIQRTELLKVFPLIKGQKLPNVAFSTSYILTPKLMEEVGHERWKSWKSVDIKSNEIDLDEHDTRKEQPYKTFFIWNQDKNKIMGGYRYFVPNKNSKPEHLATGEVFRTTEKFHEEKFPTTINLGRTFSDEALQNRSNIREGMAFFNSVYEVLAIIYLQNPQMKAFDGKVTNSFPKIPEGEYALNMALTQMQILEKEGFMEAIQPYEFQNMLHLTNGNKEEFTKYYERNWKNFQPHLNNLIRTYYTTAQNKGEPSKLITFGTGTYPKHETGYDGIETAIMINFKDFSDNRVKTYIEPNRADRQLQEKIAADFDIYKGITLPKK